MRLERRLLVPVDLPGRAVRVIGAAAIGPDRLVLTDEQAAAVDRREGSLSLAAGAGSGKTRVLVERFVRAVVDDGVAVDRILAITFTEKAAAELRQRIRRRLLEIGARDLAREAERAWISTIHGFCARVLRAHPLAAGIDPDFRVLDETQAARLAVAAFDEALEQFLAAGGAGERVDLIAAYTPDGLERMVRTVYARLRTRGARSPRLPPIDSPAAGDARERLERALAAAGAALGGPAEGVAVDRARERIDQLTASLADVPRGQLGDHERFAALAIRRGRTRALAGTELDELEASLERWVAACRAARAHDDYVLLSTLLERYGARYAAAKAGRAALDFDDLELHARDLLADDFAPRERLAARFEHVMVDEYQDTNPLQHELLELLARDNLFTVGDAFQSIYGFRGADVEVFRTRHRAACAAGRSGELTTSFRASAALIAAVNAAFSPLFGDDYRPLRPAPAASSGRGDEPCVELLLVDRSRARWEDALGEAPFGESLGEVPPWRAAEARLVASRVLDLTGPGGPHGPGDVAVLVRAGTDLAAYERALAELGIPTYAVGGGGYWRRAEIADLRAYLAALANPLDELALLGVLASPLAGVSLAALVALRRHARSLGRDLWWTLEEAFADDGDGSAALGAALAADDRERLATLVRRFSDERARASQLSLEALIDRAVTGSGYDLTLLAARDGARRMANVRKLMRLARTFEHEGGRDVRGLIDAIDEQELIARREAEAPLEGEGVDAVRLMTIHAAKGLEFPVVVVADLGREGSSDDVPLQVSADGRVGLEVASLAGRRDPALALPEIREDARRTAEDEERRIVYVAMTRARERLIVSGAVDVERWPEPAPLGAPIDWIWRAVAPDAPARLGGRAQTIVDLEAPNGERAAVRAALLTPATIDELLLDDRRRPPPAATGERGLPPAGEPADEPGDEAPGGLVAPHFPAPVARFALPVARLSYSALESYRRCAYRFYIERVVGMRGSHRALAAERGVSTDDLPMRDQAPAGADMHPFAGQLSLGGAGDARTALSPLMRGTLAHQLLERIDLVGSRRPEISDVERLVRAAGVEPSAAEAREIVALVEGFLASPLCARLRRAQRVRRELPFALTLELDAPLLVTGVLDVHAEESDGRALIVDYKTDPVATTPDAAAGRYATQRTVYALAALHAGSARVEVAHCFLERPDEPSVARFTQDDVAALAQALRAAAAGLVAGRFEPSAAPHRDLCHDCPARPALCTWPTERTLAAAPPPDAGEHACAPSGTASAVAPGR